LVPSPRSMVALVPAVKLSSVITFEVAL
jgi:hypothetical protein